MAVCLCVCVCGRVTMIVLTKTRTVLYVEKDLWFEGCVEVNSACDLWLEWPSIRKKKLSRNI